MKTKIVKSKGVYQLIIDDKKINEAYSFSDPILLACLSNYADSQNWTLSDVRLSENLNLSPYLFNSVEEYNAHNEEEFHSIISQLRTYKTSDKPLHLYWNTYNTLVLDDADNQPSLKGLNFPDFACFSFQHGYQKLREMKEFWENIQEPYPTSEHLIENKHRQPSSSSFFHAYFIKNRNNFV